MNEVLAEPAILLAGQSVLLEDVLRYAHQRGRLLPLLQEAVIDRVVRTAAAERQLTISDSQLQLAADEFRRQQGLESAAETFRWLQHRQLSVADFEAGLETELLREQLGDAVLEELLPAFWAQQRGAYDRIRWSQILVGREDLAQEILLQLQSGEAEFPDLARALSMHPSATAGGAMGEVFRRELPPALLENLNPALAGSLYGPYVVPEGILIARIEAVQEARLDTATLRAIRAELFEAWVTQRLRQTPSSFPLLQRLTGL